MTQRGQRFARIKKTTDAIEHVGIGAQLIGVEQTPGYDQGVVIDAVDVADARIDIHLPSLVEVFETLNRLFFERDDIDSGTGLAQDIARSLQFGLFETIGGYDRNATTLDLF